MSIFAFTAWTRGKLMTISGNVWGCEYICMYFLSMKTYSEMAKMCLHPGLYLTLPTMNDFHDSTDTLNL